MLKKMMSIVLAGTLCFSMCACGSSSDHSNQVSVNQQIRE